MTTKIHNGHVLGVAAFLFMPLGIFVPLGIAPLLITAAVAAVVVERVTKKRWPSPPFVPACIIGIIILWALVSTLWTTDPGTAADKLPRLLGLMVAGLIVTDIALGLSQMERRILARLLIAGILLGIALTAIERFADAPIVHLVRKDWVYESLTLSSLNRGATMFALLVWPATLLLYRWRRGAAALFWIGTLALLQTLISGAAVLAVLAGGVVFLLAWFAPRKSPIIVAVLVSAYMLTSPLISTSIADRYNVMRYEYDLPRSTYHRLLVWSFASERILERPILGWGFGSSRRIPGGNVMVDTSEQAMPLHPHNGALQLWLELGVVGAFLATLLAVYLLFAIRRAPLRVDNAATLGFFTSTFVILCISYGMWQSWWLSAIWLVSVFMVAARNDREEGASAAPANSRQVPVSPPIADRRL